MANPARRVVKDEAEVRLAKERYEALEAELQVTRLRNQELLRGLQE